MLNFFDFSTHSGDFLKQNATYSSYNVLHSLCFFVLTVLELITKALGKCTEIHEIDKNFTFIDIF